MKYLGLLFLPLLLAASSLQYSQQLAAKMINLAASTYKLDPTQQRCSKCYPQFHLAEVFEIEDLLTLIGYDKTERAVIVAFRGSDTLLNWVLDDFRAYMIEYPHCEKCRIHAGFYHAIESLEERGLISKIMRVILNDYPQAQQIIFTGHSLGGALANIAALNCNEKAYAKGLRISLYTFGQPRVGNDYYAAYHTSKVKSYYRIVHYGDLVAHEPKQMLGYRHSGQQKWYSYNMKSLSETCQGDSPNCSNSLTGSVFTPFLISIIDHAYWLYQNLKIK